jgi:hypothetical protein
MFVGDMPLPRWSPPNAAPKDEKNIPRPWESWRGSETGEDEPTEKGLALTRAADARTGACAPRQNLRFARPTCADDARDGVRRATLRHANDALAKGRSAHRALVIIPLRFSGWSITRR